MKEILFLLAPLAVVPLCLSRTKERIHPFFRKILLGLVPAAAILLVISFQVDAGHRAFLLALPWLLLTVLLSFQGAVNLLRRGISPLNETALDFAFIYLAVGGVWAVASRAGAGFMGFAEPTVLLTAIHFHFAGFAALIVAGLFWNLNQEKRWPRLYIGAVTGLIAGMPLVAIGISTHHRIETAAGILFAIAAASYAVFQFRVALRSSAPALMRACLMAGSICLVLGMALAALYASGRSFPQIFLTIPFMVASHGIFNSVGFVSCSLMALVLIPVNAPPLHSVPFSRIYGKRTIGPDFFERLKFHDLGALPALGLVDDLGDYRRLDFEPGKLPPLLRDFYEKTADYTLDVVPHWTFGFRAGGRFYAWLAKHWGQMALPVGADERGTQSESRIFPLNSELDGRKKVRAWVRKYKRDGEPLYLAAYANHKHEGVTYMNIAFPFPGGNITSVLHLKHGHSPAGEASLVLTSANHLLHAGDQGVYFVNKFLPLRLPLNERIEVWEENGKLQALHDMWFFGIRFLTLSYRISAL